MRRPLLCAAAALLCAAAAYAGADQAYAWFKSGKYVEAAAEYQNLVDRSPDYDYGWFMLGHCLLGMNRPADAEAAFRRALGLRRDRAEYYYGLALALRDGGRYGPAVEVLGLGLPLASEPRAKYAFYFMRGSLFAALERWSDAAVDLERARAVKTDPGVLDQLGRAYAALGRWDRAARAFHDLLELDSAYDGARRQLVDALLRLSGAAEDPSAKRAIYAEAYEQARRVVAAGDDEESQNLLGRAAMGAGRLDEAQAAFEKVLGANPGFCPALVNLGRVRLARDEVAAAVDALETAARCAPRAAPVFESLGAALARLDRWEDALRAFRRAQALRPTPFTTAGIAEAERRLGDDGYRSVKAP